MLLPPGKLEAAFLAELLQSLPQAPEVILGPGIGHDVTVLDLGQPELLVVKTDPITFATDEIGYYAVAVNSNDIATSGGRPRWFLATVLLPAGATTPALVRDVFRQLHEACDQLGLALVGGHTEITAGLDRPVVVGQMLGQVPRARLVRPDRVQPGDVILLTKSFPLEGTALLARECGDELRRRGYAADFVQRCAAFLHDPGLMVLPEAQALCDAVLPHALHDPTEGGLATGLWELAAAGGVGLRVEAAALPLLPEGQRLCAEFGLDPLGLIASGALLAAVAPADEAAACAACAAVGVPCRRIGTATLPAEGVVLVEAAGERPLPRYDQDEITRALA